MATTVRFYPSHSNSIHYNNMAGWGDFVNNTNSTAVGGSAGTKNLNTGNLTLRYESGQFFSENSAQGGQKWQELSRLAFLFNTTSLPDTLSVTGITLSLKVESINNSGSEGWYKDFSIAPYAYNPDSTSSISTAEYDNFGNIAFAGSVSSSTFSNEQRISFTLTDLDWINADGISRLGLRFLEDVNYDPPSWFPMQWSDVRFFDHNSVTDNRPYIDVTYEDATSYSETFDERVGSPTTTEPGAITATAQGGDVTVSGGTTTTSGSYTIHTFTGSGTFSVSGGTASVEYLVVAGGGGAGTGSAGGGGGGAGGYLTNVGGTKLDISADTTVTIGAGGTGGAGGGENSGTAGANSVFGSVTATGGGFGAGGTSGANGGTGGSGGGGRYGGSGGAGTSGQGNSGGGSTQTSIRGGGGGGGSSGAGGTGTSSAGGSGGAGSASTISGSSVTYASGGEGGTGYAGGVNQGADATLYGSGGEGSGFNDYSSGANIRGGNGKIGIVIVRYTSDDLSASSGGGTTTVKKEHTGSDQTFTVPSGITSLDIKMWGGAGAGGADTQAYGGAGGYTSGTLAVSAGDELKIIVGGGGSGATGGYGGGGNGQTGIGGGGGRSAIRTSSGSVDLLTAGGGGGSGWYGGGSYPTAYGGAGGGTSGQQGDVGQNGGGSAPSPGTQSSGGGGQYSGGNASSQWAGGGGSGWYGSGGAGNIHTPGSGGSGYIGGSGVTDGVTTAGSDATTPNASDDDYISGVGVPNTTTPNTGSAGGNGLVVITYSSGSGSSGSSSDSDWDKVTMLIQSETDNGSTTFVNTKNSSYSFAQGGAYGQTGTNITHSTAQAKWGDSSIRYYQSSNHVVTGYGADDFNFGADDFTVELWFRLNTVNLSSGHVSRQQGLLSWLPDPSANSTQAKSGWQLGLQENGTHPTFSFNGVTSSYTSYVATSWTPTVNTWYHMAVSRNGSDLELYADGTRIANANIGTQAITDAWGTNKKFRINYNVTWTSASSGYYVFNYDGGNDCYIEDIRITKGKGRYTGTSLTVPTATFLTGGTTSTSGADGDSYWHNNVLLINSEDQSFQDKSPSGHTVTAVGGAGLQYNEAFIKYGTGSLYFDGNGDYLSCGTNDDFAFDTGDFTIELWAYHTSLSGQQTYTTDPYGNNSDGIYFAKNSSHKVGMYTSSWQITGSTSLTVDTWHHIALVRNSGTLKIYLDGTEDASVSNTTNFAQTQLTIGDSSGTTSGEFVGYMDDIRITKGVARYTENFTAPTAGFKEYALQSDVTTYGGDEHWGKVSAYYKFNSDLTDYSHEDPIITTYRDPAINTDNKVSVGSLKTYISNPRTTKSGFDIRGDSVNFGTEEYTIESWLRLDTKPYYTNATTDEGTLLDFRETVTDSSETPLDGVLEWVGVEQNTPISSVDDEDFRLTYKLKGSTEVKTSKALVYSAPVTTGDANWSKVDLLIQSNSTDSNGDDVEGTDAEYSDNNISLGSNTNAVDMSTGVDDPWGGSLPSIYINSGERIQIPANTTLWNGLESDFTFETWVYQTNDTVPTWACIFEFGLHNAGGSNDGFGLFISSSQYLHVNHDGITANSTSGGMTRNTWHHVAFVKHGSNKYTYLNGTRFGNFTTGTDSPQRGSNNFWIGTATHYATWDMSGYINDFRVTNGLARYTGATFSSAEGGMPSTWTEPFHTSGTVTGSGEEVVDFRHFAVGRRTPYYPELSSDSGFEGTYSSGVAPSWTKQGSAGTYTEETTIKRSGSKSQKIALSNQGFTTRHDSITQTANKFYRLEAWVYTTVEMDVRIRDYNGASGDTWSTFTVSPNVWTKIFKNPLKKGNTTGQFEISVDTAVTGNIYIDDFSCKEVTVKQYIHYGGEQIICIDTPPTKFEGQPVLFGTSEQSNPNSVNSFWDDLRITNGKNRYTVDYDEPTTEFYTYEPPVLKGDEYWAETVLYMNADKSSILDSSATGHSITSGGTPTVDFTVYKLGAGSIFYDGTNDYNIVGDHANWDFGTGDFTIEFWVRLTASESQGWLFGWDGESGVNSDWKIGFGMSSGSTRQVEFYDMVGNSSAPVVSTTSLNNNGTTWHHIAICRKDNEHKIFIDGSLDKTHTFSGTQSSFNNVTTNRYIGQSASDTTKRFGGYLDEIRITKGQARYTTTVDLQTDVFPILAQYVDYQGEDITVDIDDSSFSVLHGYEDLDTMFSANTIQFIGNEMAIVPEISHDPHSANTTDYASSTTTYDNDTLFRYQIRDTNSSIIRDVANSDNKHTYFAYQFDGNTPVFHKIAIASFQTGSPPSSDLWDATYLRGTPDLNKNHYNQEEFETSDWFQTTAVQQTKDNFTANQFIFNAGCSFHIIPDLTTIGTMGSTAGTSDYIPGATSDSTDVLTESHVYDAMEYTADATLSVVDDSGNKAIFASEELVTETKQELLEDVIVPFDSWATNKVASFGSNFEFLDGEPSLTHNDFYSVRNDTTEANVDDNDLGDYEFYQGNEIALNPKIIRTLMGSSAYSAEENIVEEKDFSLEDSIISVSEFTNAEVQIAGDVLAPVFDERYKFTDPYDASSGKYNVKFAPLNEVVLDASLDMSLRTEKAVSVREQIQYSETGTEVIEYSPNSIKTNIMARREQFSGSQTISYDTRYAESTVSTGANGLKYEDASGAVDAYFDLVQFTNEGFLPVHSITANNDQHATNGAIQHTQVLEDEVSTSDTETDAYFVTDTVVKTYFTVDIPEEDAVAEGDTHFGDVVLLVQSDNTDGSTTFTDTSLSGHTITASGQVHHETDQKKFGTSSIHFDGTGDYLSVSDNNDWNFGSNPFTIELWVNLTSWGSNNSAGLITQIVDGNNQFVLLAENWSGVNKLRLRCRNGSSTSIFTEISVTDGLTTSEWTHLAIVADGSNISLYKNGTSIGSSSFSGSIPDFSAPLNIGRRSDQVYYFNGYMEDIRITKGVARHTANFSVPTTAVQTSTGNTSDDSLYDRISLLIQSDTTDGSTTFLDGSENVHTITPTNQVHHDVNQKKFGNTSIYFDGTGDYLTVAEDNTLVLSGDFTIETWIYFSDTTTAIFIDNRSANGPNSIALYQYSTKLYVYIDTADKIVSSNGAISANTWYHVAVTRENGNMKLFIDGTQAGSTWSDSTNRTYDDADWVFGRYKLGSGQDLAGYMEDIRITRHTARYTSNFTKPSLAFKGATAQTSNNIGSDVPEFEMEDSWFQATPSTSKTYSYDNFTPETFQFDGNNPVVTVEERITSSRNLDGTIGSQKKSQYKFSGQGVIPVVHYDTYKDGSGASSDYSPSFVLSNKPLLTGATTVSYVKPTETWVPAELSYDHSKTVLLIQSEATDGNTDFDDTGASDHTITKSGTVRHETDNKKFGNSSIYMNNSRSSYLEIPDSTDFTWGNGDWTIEYWIKRDHAGSDREYVWCWLPSDGTEDLSFRFESDTSAVFHISNASGSHISGATATITVPSHGTTNWHHHAFVRNGADIDIYIDGVSIHNYDIGASTSLLDSSVALRIGTQGHWGFSTGYDWGFGGYFEEFRISKGVARYTADFDDDLPDSPFPTSSVSGAEGYYATTFPTITTTAKERYIDYQYDDSGTIKYWGTTDGQIRPYTSAPNNLTKLHVDEDVGNYLHFIEAKVGHVDWQQNITNELDTDSSSETYNELVFIQEIEPVGKYKPENFQFSGNENVFIVDARWSNDMLKWADSNFNSVTEGGVGHNTSIQFTDGRFVNTVNKFIVPSGIPVFASKDATEEVVLVEDFSTDVLSPARDYFGSNQIQMQAGFTFSPTLDLSKHFDIDTAEGQFYALASGTFVDITSVFNSSTQKLTLTFSSANQMTDYTVGESTWVGRFEASSSGQSVTLKSNTLYVIDSVNTQTLQLVLSIPAGQEATFTPPEPPGDEIDGDVTIITSSQNLAQLYYILKGI